MSSEIIVAILTPIMIFGFLLRESIVTDSLFFPNLEILDMRPAPE